MNPEVGNGIDVLESWWGEGLGEELIQRVRVAPEDHIVEFFSYYVDRCSQSRVLPDLEPGKLRPILQMSTVDEILFRDRWRYCRAASGLLLYAHEIVLEDPIIRASVPHILGGPANRRENLATALSYLLQIKSLVSAGIVHLHYFSPDLRHPARAHRHFNRLFDENFQLSENFVAATAEAERLLSRMETDQLSFSLKSEIGMMINHVTAEPEKGMVLSRSRLEAAFYEVGLYGVESNLGDLRTFTLAKLAALNVPTFTLSSKDLRLVRENDELFAEWRASLSAALGEIENISYEDNAWKAAASSIVKTEMAPVLSRAENAVRKSPFLESARFGFSVFSFSGIGAATGLAFGENVAAAVVGSGAAVGLQVFKDYVDALRRRRQHKAILGLTLGFEQSNEE